jgi:hypothetical protein
VLGAERAMMGYRIFAGMLEEFTGLGREMGI